MIAAICPHCKGPSTLIRFGYPAGHPHEFSPALCDDCIRYERPDASDPRMADLNDDSPQGPEDC